MGYSYNYSQSERDEWEREQRSRRATEAHAKKKARMKLADKLVMVMIDRINQVVVRPGPDPEERECYDMAKEIRDISPDLSALVERVLKVHEDEPPAEEKTP